MYAGFCCAASRLAGGDKEKLPRVACRWWEKRKPVCYPYRVLFRGKRAI
jgi:hypothetical protein